jgi:2'-5' RNA ligase
MARLFVAIRPPADLVAYLRSLPRAPAPGLVWSEPERWVVKLRPLGSVGDHLIDDLVDALAAELDGAPAATCVLGPATRRVGGQWLGVPVTGLDDLSATVFDATVALVPVTHPQPFRADVGLASGRVPKELAGQPAEFRWTADEVVLVADRSAPGRTRLEDLAAFPLSG